MNSARRKLFKGDCSNSWTPEEIVESETSEGVANCPTGIVEYTVVNEGNTTPKTQIITNPQGIKTPQDVVFGPVTPLTKKDQPKKVLVIHEANEERIRKSWTGLRRLEKMGITICQCSDVISVCTRERFSLIFLDMSSVASNAQKICSTMRYNSNSLNRAVAIIGVTEEESQDFSSHGINDVIHLPFTEESMNQILLKWARQKSCEGMPLTPESPEDDIQLARKAVDQIAKEADEGPSPLLNYSQGSHFSPSVQQDFDQQSVSASAVVVPAQYDKPALLQSNQSEPCYQQPFANRSCATSASIPTILTRDVDITQHHHMAGTYGLHQAHNHISNITTQRFLHTGIHQDQALLSQIQPRQADYIPGHPGQAALVPGRSSGLANQIYPGHFNQGHMFHNISSSDPFRPNTMPQHFIPVNPPPLYPSTLMPNPGSHRASNIAALKTEPLPSTQESPGESSGKTVGSPAYMISGELGSKDMKITLLSDDLSKHSSKERVRRERIKESCDQLRFLLPSITGRKSDMASILEMAVKYVRLVKERLPPSVIQEISDTISATTTVIPRKRPSRDLSGNTKQTRPRLTPPAKDQDMPTRLSHSLPSFCMRGVSLPIQAKAPTMVTSTGPVYLPHLHIRPGHEHPRIPIPHQPDQIGFRPPGSPPSAFNSCRPANTMAGNVTVAHHAPRLLMNDHTSTTIHQECNAPQSSLLPKHPYYGNPITVPSIGNHSYEMPQQWSFLKLPPIGNIFHSLSSSNLSQGSVEHESSESGRSSPADSAMTPPLWEGSGGVILGQDDQAHTEGPLSYKGASI